MSFIEMNFHSEMLGMASQVWVVLPQRSTAGLIGLDGKTPPPKYKCLYLLHGMSDDHTIWMRRTSIERYATRYGIAVVMPNGARSFYLNMAYGPRYFDYLTKELPALMEDTFSISSDPKDRYIAGLSMGGYGAMMASLRTEGQYTAAAALSPVSDLQTFMNESDLDRDARQIFGPEKLVGPEADLVKLAKNCKLKPRLYMAIGLDDRLRTNNGALRETFAEEGYDFTYKEAPGNHNWDFWDEQIVGVLEWMFGEN